VSAQWVRPAMLTNLSFTAPSYPTAPIPPNPQLAPAISASGVRPVSAAAALTLMRV